MNIIVTYSTYNQHQKSQKKNCDHYPSSLQSICEGIKVFFEF